MSTVVTAIRDNKIHMCGDTAGSYSNGTLVTSSKVLEGVGYVVGCCGTREPYLCMYYNFGLPPFQGLSRKDYIAGPLRATLNDVLGHLEEDTFGMHLGFYYWGLPCIVEVNGSVGGMEEVTHTNWVCTGTGREVAMGAMESLWDSDITGQELVIRAVTIASKYNAYTALPCEYVHLLPPGVEPSPY
jgi:hypothetical protein